MDDPLRCDYIGDSKVFRAVTFAISMIKQGKPPPLATFIAARYYKTHEDDVERYVQQHKLRSRAEREKRE